MAHLRLFGAAREAAGTGAVTVPDGDVESVLAGACGAFGPVFADVLAHSAVWLNGEAVESDEPVGPNDELAVLPPVSGG